MTSIVHGTHAGYIQCRKRPSGACDSCKKADAKYMAEWRKRNPDKHKTM